MKLLEYNEICLTPEFSTKDDVNFIVYRAFKHESEEELFQIMFFIFEMLKDKRGDMNLTVDDVYFSQQNCPVNILKCDYIVLMKKRIKVYEGNT